MVRQEVLAVEREMEFAIDSFFLEFNIPGRLPDAVFAEEDDIPALVLADSLQIDLVAVPRKGYAELMLRSRDDPRREYLRPCARRLLAEVRSGESWKIAWASAAGRSSHFSFCTIFRQAALAALPLPRRVRSGFESMGSRTHGPRLSPG